MITIELIDKYSAILNWVYIENNPDKVPDHHIFMEYKEKYLNKELL